MQSAETNFYSILQVSRHSSALEIRQAYKKVSKKLHPDKNPSPDAEAMFQEVKTAYDVSIMMTAT
jgi:molecular chaperone DnaJ